MKKILSIALAAVLLASCGTTSSITRGNQYPKMYEEKPVVLLVMPPINNTSNVEAKDLLYTSISKPLSEAGYYVLSPLLAMDILRAESAYDSELFVDGPFDRFREYFGCDAVVFSEINSWTKQGLGIRTEIRYFIKSAVTGEILFDRNCDLYLDLSVSTNSSNNSIVGLLVDLTASVINTAVTENITAARDVNYYIFQDIPRGKYNPEYQQDYDVPAEEKDITKLSR